MSSFYMACLFLMEALLDVKHQQDNHVRLGQSSQKLQQVCTLSAKKAVVEWMVEDST